MSINNKRAQLKRSLMERIKFRRTWVAQMKAQLDSELALWIQAEYSTFSLWCKENDTTYPQSFLKQCSEELKEVLNTEPNQLPGGSGGPNRTK